MSRDKMKASAGRLSRIRASQRSFPFWFVLLFLLTLAAARGHSWLVAVRANAGWLTLNDAGLLADDAPSLVHARAEISFVHATTMSQGSRSGWRGLALSRVAMGDEQGAVAAWKSAGGMAQELVSYGERVRKEQRFEEAIDWYDRAAALLPALNSEYFYLRSLALESMGEKDRSLDDLERAIALDHGWPDWESRFLAWLTWGKQLLNQEEWSRAETALDRTLQVHDADGKGFSIERSEAHRYLGLAQWQQQELEAAVENMRQAVLWNDQNVWAHVHLGKSIYFLDPGRVEETKSEFARALEITNDDAELYVNFSEFWRWVGEDGYWYRSCAVAIQELGNIEAISDVCTQP